MIWAFTGKTGSGKTYQMVRLAYKEWRKGRDIYSNTVLNFRKYDRKKIFEFLRFKKKKRGRIIYFEEITEILECRDGLIIFDEAAALFDARSWESLPREFSQKLRQHRKHSLDLYCTTQNLGTIDINYRRLVQRWFHCSDLFKWGEGRVKIGIFKREEKDIDKIFNTVDDLAVPTVGRPATFIIWWWSTALYDTLYDVGFRRFRSEVIWEYNEQGKKKNEMYIICPKELTTSNALRALQSYQSHLNPKESRYSKTNSNRYATKN